ncbi:hypothetical protein G6F43_000826 [Rhizopus delemar]|nr:hypothetical protein G6F43_000826 [Rhizopus delemar]
MEINEIEKKIYDAKLRLRGWEKKFNKKHGRQPTVEDINKRPDVAIHYKDYNKLKKQLKEITDADSQSQPQSPCVSLGSQPASPASSGSSRILFPEATKAGRPPPPPLNRQYTKEEAFWLNLPTPSSNQRASTQESAGGSSQEAPKKRTLILAKADFSKRKKRKTDDDEQKKPANKPKKPKERFRGEITPYQGKILEEKKWEKEELEDMKKYTIIQFDESQFHRPRLHVFEWDEPDFCIGSGKFGDEFDAGIPSKKERLYEKIKKGTLGAATEENKLLEKNLLDQLEQFAKEKGIIKPKPVTLETSPKPIDEDTHKAVEYKKKPIQKRRTRKTKIYREVIDIASAKGDLRWYKTMSWYYLIVTEYFLYGESIIYYFKEIVMVDAFLLPFTTHHRFISFTLYVIGFVFFVMNLKKGQYRQQMSQFGWTHMAIFLIVFQAHFIVDNILEGLIWFVMPAALVVCNDIFAYICGFFWGKTPLIQLSPKKTVEGFVGGLIFTLIFGFLITTALMRFDYIVCPVQDLGASAWSDISCEPKNPVFTAAAWRLPSLIRYVIKYLFLSDISEVYIAPIQLHTIVMACFASLIAPFGGFFASAVKRAFKIKDFGHSIPGHGGLTDRMDCQFLMGLFAFMYYHSFIKMYNVSVGTILALIINNLSSKEQLELLERLQTYLINQDHLASQIDSVISKAQNLLT